MTDRDDENKDDQLFVYKLFGISTPRRIKARSSLRQKIGPVITISDAQILKAQYFIDESSVNFTPYILDYIENVMSLISVMRDDSYSRQDYYNRIVVPIVQIKGQAAMFGNDLASIISEKILGFLEHYKRLDDDVLDILNVYCSIVKMTCETGMDGKAQNLLDEMTGALNRYEEKFVKNTGR